jgi:primosomal protein N' (replication factor Y)
MDRVPIICAIGDVYRGAMPSALLLESETFLKNRCFVDESTLSDDEFDIPSPTAAVLAQDIIAILNKKKYFPVIQN